MIDNKYSFYKLYKTCTILIALLSLLLLNGCATYMLSAYIDRDRPQTFSEPTVINKKFNIIAIKKAELDTSKKPKILYACVNAYVTNESLNDYLLTIPLIKTKTGYGLNFDGIIKGCSDKPETSSNRIPVNITELKTEYSDFPNPIFGHASYFSFVKMADHGPGGTLKLSKSIGPTNYMNYITNTGTGGREVYYYYFVKSRTIIIPVKDKDEDEEEESVEFRSKDLLVILYPVTIIWDVITSPFMLVFLLYNWDVR
ncbi:MAG: hypothetical protein ACC657_10495 [Thiohalomonadales bacterium]